MLWAIQNVIRLTCDIVGQSIESPWVTTYAEGIGSILVSGEDEDDRGWPHRGREERHLVRRGGSYTVYWWISSFLRSCKLFLNHINTEIKSTLVLMISITLTNRVRDTPLTSTLMAPTGLKASDMAWAPLLTSERHAIAETLGSCSRGVCHKALGMSHSTRLYLAPEWGHVLAHEWVHVLVLLGVWSLGGCDDQKFQVPLRRTARHRKTWISAGETR